MTATRAYFVSMFILPPCEEGTTIQIVRVWSGSPRVDRNIVLGLQRESCKISSSHILLSDY
ncbi:hypothetical protein B1T56_06515 [Escherichia coli]|nr:hypothetical protein B1T56_06515 [Escherichia coli]